MKRVLLSMAALLAACGPAVPATDAGVPEDTGPLINVFAAGPSMVAPGQAATLVFHVVDGSTATLAPGVGDVTGRTSVEVRLAQTTTFTLTATRAGRTETASVTVTVATSDAGAEADAGGALDDGGTGLDAGALTDGGTSADAGTSTDGGLDPDAGSPTDAGAVADAGVSEDGGTSASDGGATSDAGAPDTSPLINVFAAAPAQVVAGEATLLVFSTAPGATAVISPSVGDVTGQTTATARPVQDTTYTLTATRNGRTETATVAVTVVPPATRTASLRLSTDAGVVTAGVAFDVEVTVLDLAGALDPAFQGTVQVATDDAQATAPATLTFTAADQGRKTTQLTFSAAGVRTVTMADVSRPQVQGVLRLPVVAAAAQELRLALDRTTARAGEALALAVRVVDAFGNPVAATGALSVSSTDPRLWVSSDRQLSAADQGVKVLALALGTPGQQTVTVALGSLTATTPVIALQSGVATSVVFAELGTFTAGTLGTARLEVRDALGNVATDFTGTFTLTTTDPAVPPPPPVTFDSGALGSETVSLTLVTAGVQTLTATQTTTPTLTTSGQVTVAPGPFSRFLASPLPATVMAGEPVSVTVSARDAAGNTLTGFSGEASVSSTDPAAVLPANFGFVDGVKTVGLTFNTPGSQRVTVSHVGGSESLELGPVSVTPRPVVFSLGLPADVMAGVPTTVSFAAKDDRGSPVAFVGSVTLSASQGLSTSIAPGTVTLSGTEGGVATFTVTFSALGAQTLTVTDGTRTAQASTTVHGLVYTDPPVGNEKVRLVVNGGGGSLVQLDLRVVSDMVPSYAAGITLPVTPGQVQDGSPLLVEGNAYTLGVAPKAIAGALRNGVLMAGVSQKASGAGAKTTDTATVAGRVIFSLRLRLDPNATLGVVFDGQSLPASFRAAVRNRLGADVAEKADFAIGRLEVR